MAAQAIALAALVALVGMPHGGLDPRVGRTLFRPTLGQSWAIAFSIGYLAIMAMVSIGWWLIPVTTLAIFVALSMIHFGFTEGDSSSPVGIARNALLGGMVVWVPALAQPAEFTQLLMWVLPGTSWPESLLHEPALRIGLALLLPVAVISGFANSWWCGTRVVIFAAIFAILPPLLSFIAYFCGWHSGLELYRLARQANPANLWAGLLNVLREAAPYSALAVLMIAFGWWAWAADGPLTPGLVQTVFIGLSVVAVPHILLHAVAAYRDVNPFTENQPRMPEYAESAVAARLDVNWFAEVNP